MNNPNRPARLNRTLLAVAGLLLLGAGAFTVLTSTGMFPVPLPRPGSAVVPAQARPPTWALVVTAVAAVVLGLLCLRWLVAQFARKPASATLRMERDPEDGRTELSSSAAVAPLTEELNAYPGVTAAQARLSGPKGTPTLHLIVSVGHEADLPRLRERIDQEALPRLRRALDLEALPTIMETRFRSGSGPRVQ